MTEGRILESDDSSVSGKTVGDPQIRAVLESRKPSDLGLTDSTADPASFTQALNEGIVTNKHGAYAAPHAVDELDGAKTFLAPNKDAGTAVFPDGNIGHVASG